MSCGDKDGIYLWTFHGDVRTQFAHQAEHEGGFISILEEDTRPKGVLERIRDSKKEAKHQHATAVLKEGAFVLPAFKSAPLSTDPSADDQGEEASGQ